MSQHISSRQVTVGTAATPIGEGMVSGSTFHLYAEAGGNATIYVGSSKGEKISVLQIGGI